MKHKFAKRIFIVLLLSVSLLFGMTGCFLADITNAGNSSGIKEAKINESGELVIIYDDGTEQNLGKVVGEDGVAGADGAAGAPGADGKDGEDGADGKDGANGADGKDGTLEITGNAEDTVVLAAAKGLNSAVSIISTFEKTVTGYYPGSGIVTSTEEYSAGGSGVIYKMDKANGEAFIITNYHVVYDSESNTDDCISDNIYVYLFGSETEGQAMQAEYIGGSMYYDIAVLHISDSDILKTCDAAAVTVANSDDIMIGENAIAIGNAEGMGTSVTSGVVSVDSEYITMTASDNATDVTFRVMRVDTAVNHGNSGGGLFNSEGELIGIVNAKISSTDVENIGYAIPSNLAIAAADNIIYHCYLTDTSTLQRPIMGVSIITDSSYAEYDETTGYIEIIENIVVYSVTEGTLADGVFEVDDKLVSAAIGERTVNITRQHHLIDFMLTARVGDVVKFTVERSGVLTNLEVTITEDIITSY